MRLDIYLVTTNRCESRSKAQDLIKDGVVTVNKIIVRKPSFMVSTLDLVELNLVNDSFVSRSAHKLKQALDEFKIDLSNKTVLDIGASTGGFTECALLYGAAFVYAVDVGTNQLHTKLKSLPNVCSLEQTDARNLLISDFSREIDFICVDVSFISVKNILPHISKLLYDSKEVVILVKPQFELEKKYQIKNGIIKNEKLRLKTLTSVKDEAIKYGFIILNETVSQTPGRAGNIEYLLHLKK